MIVDFLSGAVTMGLLLAGLFFLRCWRRAHERLFLAFALAFWILGFAQAALTFGNILVEERSWLYLLRLAAFVLILLAVWQKNRVRQVGPASTARSGAEVASPTGEG
jgi:hypothetical protein